MSVYPNYIPQTASPIQGPKLHPFRDTNSDVKFVHLLSDVDSGGHAHVFEVSIRYKA